MAASSDGSNNDQRNNSAINSPEEAAENFALPIAAIHEIIRYCEANQELIKMEADEERYRLEQRGIDVESQTAH